MKRLLGITLAMLSLGFVASLEAKASELSPANSTVALNAAPQWQRDRTGRRHNSRRPRVITRSRVVRFGRRLYRETYQVRYMPNGRTNTRLISRVRIS
jgi:hypothetical protein